MLCFRRDYSAKHLAQHPRQTTKSILLAFQQGFIDIVVTPRQGAPKTISAGCDWSQNAGIDTSGHKMIAAFNKPGGFDCMVVVGSSAEERGYGLIDPAPDAQSLTLYLRSPIGAVSGGPDNAKDVDLTLGPQDRTFVLKRIDAKDCESFKAIVK